MDPARSLGGFVGAVLCFVFAAAALTGIVYKAIEAFRPKRSFQGPLYPTDFTPRPGPTAGQGSSAGPQQVTPVYQAPPPPPGQPMPPPPPVSGPPVPPPSGWRPPGA
ncbi:hypothetical protein [Hamadaea tsunoensis]|uniref:hypothetical protein n=1 Tax=Hamadaea tsunoensis TaxID=53368 RepID=UPI0003FEE4DE|nr:hypothetical protein [Hamadaea tsunoensis]